MADNPLQLTDRFDAICTALSSAFMSLLPNLKYTGQGWPDPKFLESTGANLPSVFFIQVSTSGQAKRSRYQRFAQDTANNLYFETQRQQIAIQITLATTNEADRTTMGAQIIQYLINSLQLTLEDGQKSLIRFRDDALVPGNGNYFLRHMTFQFQARILQSVSGTPVTKTNPNITVK